MLKHINSGSHAEKINFLPVTGTTFVPATDSVPADWIPDLGTIISLGNYAEKYVNVLSWAYSTAAADRDTKRVEPDYGRLTVLRYSAP